MQVLRTKSADEKFTHFHAEKRAHVGNFMVGPWYLVRLFDPMVLVRGFASKVLNPGFGSQVLDPYGFGPWFE